MVWCDEVVGWTLFLFVQGEGFLPSSLRLLPYWIRPPTPHLSLNCTWPLKPLPLVYFLKCLPFSRFLALRLWIGLVRILILLIIIIIIIPGNLSRIAAAAPAAFSMVFIRIFVDNIFRLLWRITIRIDSVMSSTSTSTPPTHPSTVLGGARIISGPRMHMQLGGREDWGIRIMGCMHRRRGRGVGLVRWNWKWIQSRWVG